MHDQKRKLGSKSCKSILIEMADKYNVTSRVVLWVNIKKVIKLKVISFLANCFRQSAMLFCN